MKLSILLTMVLCLNLSASVLSQKYVNLKGENMELKEVFKEIRKQTGVYFMFLNKDIKGDHKVKVDIQNKTVEESLKSIFKDIPFTYEIVEDFVVVKPKGKNTVTSQQQKSEIKGKVLDEKGKPMPGVTIQLEGVSMGTATDINGNFKMDLPVKKGVLIFSFVGYKTQKVKFESGKLIKVKMIEDRANLDEVKVTAYGTTTKREMTGSITSVKGEALKDVPAANLATALQGRIAGMDIQNMSGAPGSSGVATTVRGYNSLDSETRGFSSPLWVVDGVPISNMSSSLTGTNALAEIDPSMIESIEVLKDASAAALYGSRAANGVILVTTKKGRKGESKISANVSYSYSFIPELPTLTLGQGARSHKEEALRNYREAGINEIGNDSRYPESYYDAYEMNQTNSFWNARYDYWWQTGQQYQTPKVKRVHQDSLNPFYNNRTNWFDIFFQSGKVIDANIQARGGNEHVTYSFGVGMYSEQGILENSGFDRGTMLAAINFKPVKRATIDFRVFGSYSARTRTSFGKVELEQLPKAPFEQATYLPGLGSIVAQTSLMEMNDIKQKNNDFRLRANFSFIYEIIDGLRLKTMNSVDYAVSKYNRFYPSYLNLRNQSSSFGGAMDFMNVLSENLLEYKKSINGIHNIDMLAGFTYQTDKSTTYRGYGKNSPSDHIHYVTNTFPFYEERGDNIYQLNQYTSNFEESILVSLLARFKYNYDKKYLFEASIRRDGSSKFGRSIPWGTFPAFSAGWVFSEENFMDFLPQLDFGKVRASWGVSGMTFEQPYLAYGLLKPGTNTFQENPTIGADGSGLLNPNLGWEETIQTNIGLDLDLFNYRIGLVLDYYHRYTKGLLGIYKFPGTQSHFGAQWRNLADISNEGLELAIKADIIRKEDFTWNINFNIARNWNMFRKSYDGRDINRAYVLGKPLNGVFALLAEGVISDDSNLPFRYSTDGVKKFFNAGYIDAIYRVGDTKYVDYNGDVKIDEQDEIYQGSPLPKAFGGLLNEIKYKNFDLNFLFSYSLGRTILNMTTAKTIRVTEENIISPLMADVNAYSFWEKPGDITDYPRNEYDSRKNNYESSRFVEKNVNYVKLKNVILGYRIPKELAKKMGISGARVFFSGENLLTITNYKGLDPETVDIRNGYDEGRNYPLTRKFTMGLTVNF